MMREQVCIVLNEREPQKAKMAETLATRLKALNITSSRLEIDKNIERNVLQRSPRVLVLDYLLGDFSTGLDILAHINDIDQNRRPKVFFLTDEPSVPVAVEAIKLGALDYLELDKPHSIAKLTEEIEHALRNTANSPRPEPSPPLLLDDLIANTQNSIALLQQAKTLVLKRAPIVIIYGPGGSGRTCLAKALQATRQSASLCRYLRLSMFDGELSDTLGTVPGFFGLRLGSTLSLVIEEAEEDDGELLSIISEQRANIWASKGKTTNDSFLTLTTSDLETLRAWQRMCEAEVLKLPPLSEREQDIPALCQRFVREAEDAFGGKIKPFDSATISWLCEQAWPQNIRQLHSIVTDAAIAGSFAEMPLKEILQEKLELWGALHSKLAAESKPSALLAATVLERSNHNYRIAAARLGCRLSTLSELLRNGHK